MGVYGWDVGGDRVGGRRATVIAVERGGAGAGRAVGEVVEVNMTFFDPRGERGETLAARDRHKIEERQAQIGPPPSCGV